MEQNGARNLKVFFYSVSNCIKTVIKSTKGSTIVDNNVC